MIFAAAYFYSIFFKHTHTGCCFSGIQQGSFCAFQHLCHFVGVGGDAAHALQIVQGSTFAGKQHTDVAGYRCHQLTFCHSVTIGYIEIYLCIRVKQLEGSFEYAQTSDNAVLFADQLHFAFLIGGHDRIGGNVFAVDVFFQCHTDIFIGYDFHCNGIHKVTPFRMQFSEQLFQQIPDIPAGCCLPVCFCREPRCSWFPQRHRDDPWLSWNRCLHGCRP